MNAFLSPCKHCACKKIVNLVLCGKRQGMRLHVYTARVYDNGQLVMRGLENKEIKCGDVVIIRYEGPNGGPGLPEMRTPTIAIIGAGLRDCVELGSRNTAIVNFVSFIAVHSSSRSGCIVNTNQNNIVSNREIGTGHDTTGEGAFFLQYTYSNILKSHNLSHSRMGVEKKTSVTFHNDSLFSINTKKNR